MAAHFLISVILLLQAISSSSASNSSSAAIGINYGQVADNLPSPEAVIPLLRTLGVGRVKLYDTDPRVLRAFADSGVEFVVGLPDNLVPKVRDPAVALAWVKTNIHPHLPRTRIAAVTVGNEVLSGNDTALIQSLVPAMQSIHSALATLGLDRQVAVTTAHSLAVLSTSFPPSAGAFRHDLVPCFSPLLSFLSKTGSPFLINAYPYFAYKADPKRVALDYVLFQPNQGVLDPGSGLRYDNMLHAQVDAVRAAIAAAGGGKGVDIRVSETGWPSAGDEDEVGATADNARRYNGNLMRMVAEGKATPMAPRAPLHVYVFALFNENLKPGPASERHYGLFKPDGTPAYQIVVAEAPADNSTAPTAGAGAHSPGASSTSYYSTISSAPNVGAQRMSAMIATSFLGLVLRLA